MRVRDRKHLEPVRYVPLGIGPVACYFGWIPYHRPGPRGTRGGRSPGRVAGCGRGTVLIKHITNIRTSGTVMPSSPYLIQRLLRPIDFDTTLTLVQLGVGSGCITRELLRRMRPDARLICLELNDAFVRECSEIRDERLVLLHACATTLDGVLDEQGLDAVDCVVSSLPLTIMDPSVVDRILEVSRARLRRGGKFLQYQYTLRHLAELSRRYGEVRLGFTLRNVPPAFIYECSAMGAD